MENQAKAEQSCSLPTISNNSKKKRESRIRQKDSRSFENVTVIINDLPEDARLEALLTRYSDLYEEYRKYHLSSTSCEKRVANLAKENHQLHTEQGKLVLARSRIESLCRELQRQNKLIKDENIAKIREEEEKRKEVTSKFQLTLNEVTVLMQESAEKNTKLRDDNLDMSNKIESLQQVFEERKDQNDKFERQAQLEIQLAKAHVEKAHLELKAEQEKWGQERALLQRKLQAREEESEQLKNTIQALQDNLSTYSEKYEEFRTTLVSSNQVFNNCKADMSKMGKHIATLENELKAWKNRYQRTAQSLLDMTANKQVIEQKNCVLERKLDKLQKLCRHLQKDRSTYLKLLKNNGIEPTPEDTSEESLSSVSSEETLKTPKEKDLENLKDNLKALQTKLASLQFQMAVNGQDDTLSATSIEETAVVPETPLSSLDEPIIDLKTSSSCSVEVISTASTSSLEEPTLVSSMSDTATDSNVPGSSAVEEVPIVGDIANGQERSLEVERTD